MNYVAILKLVQQKLLMIKYIISTIYKIDTITDIKI